MPHKDNSRLAKLAERTEYEVWLLEEIYDLVENKFFPQSKYEVIFPANKSVPRCSANVSCSLMSFGDWRPRFLNAGAPLVFVTTFKLLDMLIECFLEKKGSIPSHRFQVKIQELNELTDFPEPVKSRDWLKDRLINLYETIDPLRGTIIHDKEFTRADGGLTVAATRKKADKTPVHISADQLRTFARTIVSVLRYIDGTWYMDDFREKLLRYDLDNLGELHKLPLLGQKLPFHLNARLFIKEKDMSSIDLAFIREYLKTRYVENDCSFDLNTVISSNGTAVDSFYFPWDVVRDKDDAWNYLSIAENHKTVIPENIDPEYLSY